MEGSPGVGKSSIVAALAKRTGNELVRINLSEQTEISDLIGSDLPSEGKNSMCFEWHDGPLLAAMKSGHWILLDELNLGNQNKNIFFQPPDSAKYLVKWQQDF